MLTRDVCTRDLEFLVPDYGFMGPVQVLCRGIRLVMASVVPTLLQ